MRPQLNHREQSSSGTGARERNRAIREEKKRRRKRRGEWMKGTESKTVGAALFLQMRDPGIDPTRGHIKHISVCQSELKPRKNRGSRHDSTLPRPGSKHSEDFPLA